MRMQSTLTSTGFCMYNSGGSNAWQLFTGAGTSTATCNADDFALIAGSTGWVGAGNEGASAAAAMTAAFPSNYFGGTGMGSGHCSYQLGDTCTIAACSQACASVDDCQSFSFNVGTDTAQCFFYNHLPGTGDSSSGGGYGTSPDAGLRTYVPSTAGGALCACIPKHDYVTLAGVPINGNAPFLLGYDQFQWDSHPNSGALFNEQLCCQMCFYQQGPSAPPAPPALPNSPDAPPLPPGTPPPPPMPLYPPNTVLASAASAPITFGSNCKGIVITADNRCYMMPTNEQVTHSDESGGLIQGAYMYSYSSPPPPPLEPSSAVCRTYSQHPRRDHPEPLHHSRLLARDRSRFRRTLGMLLAVRINRPSAWALWSRARRACAAS